MVLLGAGGYQEIMAVEAEMRSGGGSRDTVFFLNARSCGGRPSISLHIVWMSRKRERTEGLARIGSPSCEHASWTAPQSLQSEAHPQPKLLKHFKEPGVFIKFGIPARVPSDTNHLTPLSNAPAEDRKALRCNGGS